MRVDNILIKTEYGDIEVSGRIDKGEFIPDDLEISTELGEFLGKWIEAGKLFFSDDEIDMTDHNIDDDLVDELKNFVTLSDFSDPMRALALHQYSGYDFVDIEEDRDPYTFTSGREKYLVLTDDEADEIAKERVENLLDDVGFDGFSEWARDHALDNFIDTDWFDDAKIEMSMSYAEDIKHEGTNSDEYINRLHEEMVELGILSEPEWPEEPDESDYTYEREEFDSSDFYDNEPVKNDYETEEEWEEAHSKWEDELSNAEEEWEEEQDRLEEEAQEEYDDAIEAWEREKEEYKSDLEDDIDNNIEEFAETRVDDEDGVEYWKNNIGDISDIVKEHGLLDEDAFIEWIVDTDGRGTNIASYDGEEYEETVSLNGETENFYIYRTE